MHLGKIALFTLHLHTHTHTHTTNHFIILLLTRVKEPQKTFPTSCLLFTFSFFLPLSKRKIFDVRYLNVSDRTFPLDNNLYSIPWLVYIRELCLPVIISAKSDLGTSSFWGSVLTIPICSPLLYWGFWKDITITLNKIYQFLLKVVILCCWKTVCNKDKYLRFGDCYKLVEF